MNIQLTDQYFKNYVKVIEDATKWTKLNHVPKFKNLDTTAIRKIVQLPQTGSFQEIKNLDSEEWKKKLANTTFDKFFSKDFQKICEIMSLCVSNLSQLSIIPIPEKSFLESAEDYGLSYLFNNNNQNVNF